MQALPQLKDVSSDQQSHGGGGRSSTIDRDAAARFGIPPADIDAAIYDLLGQREVAQYFTQHEQLPRGGGGAAELQADARRCFNTVYLLSPLTGKTVPLSLFVKVNPNATASLTISHQGEYPAATLSFNLAPGVSLGQATQAVREGARQAGRAAHASPARSRARRRPSSSRWRPSRS